MIIVKLSYNLLVFGPIAFWIFFRWCKKVGKGFLNSWRNNTSLISFYVFAFTGIELPRNIIQKLARHSAERSSSWREFRRCTRREFVEWEIRLWFTLVWIQISTFILLGNLSISVRNHKIILMILQRKLTFVESVPPEKI